MLLRYDATPHGKLLITSEYFVLGGAMALAMPVKFGQQVRIWELQDEQKIVWESHESDGTKWFSAEFSLPDLAILSCNDAAVAARARQILSVMATEAPYIFASKNGWRLIIQSQFPRHWGLGTSSTLVAALAQFAGIDPYLLLAKTFGGSGYDLACAFANQPILYQLNGGVPHVKLVDFEPDFSENLYFVYLGNKMDSREGIKIYKQNVQQQSRIHEEISDLTMQFLKCLTQEDFEELMIEHENLVATALHLKKVKDLLFSDYWGQIKSLGAWGGDFVLVTSQESEARTREYFSQKGCPVFFTWRDLKL